MDKQLQTYHYPDLNSDNLSSDNLNSDNLSLILSYLDIVDLIAASAVCRSWRDVALYRLDKVTSLLCDVIKSNLRDRRLLLSQRAVESMIRYCKSGVKRLDLRVSDGYKVYQDLGRLFRLAHECEKLEEILVNIPQNAKISRHEITLPRTLKRVELRGHLREELLSELLENAPNLESVVLDNNSLVTGDFVTQHLSRNKLKEISLHRCSKLTSNNIHFILKNYPETLEYISITGFPTVDLLQFEKSDISEFKSMKTLELGSWYARDSLKFSLISPLLDLMPSLTTLCLQHCCNLDENPGNLVFLTTTCPNLETLDLTGCVLFSADNLAPVTKLSKLKKLVLHRVKITGEGQIFDFDIFVSTIVLKLKSLEYLYLEDPSRLHLQDSHVYKIISSELKLTKLSVLWGCGIDGSFIDKCSKLQRSGEIDVFVTTQKGNARGDALSGRMCSTPPFLRVFVSWEEY